MEDFKINYYNKNFNKLSLNVLGLILDFCSYNEFIRFIFINKKLLRSIRQYIKNKVYKFYKLQG